jgi:hypothetical protein
LSAADQAKYSRSRGDGTGPSQWIERTQFEKSDPAAKPAAAPGERVKIGDYDLSAEDIAGILRQKAESDLRAAKVPDHPSKYELKLPEGWTSPAGQEFRFDASDPAWDAARTWAHSKGFDQQTFSEMAALYAGHQAKEQATLQAAAAAEREKLGVNATARVTAVDTWLRSIVGDTSAKAMRCMMVSAGIIEGFEKLAHKFSSQGAAPFSQAHRDHPEAPGRVSEEQWAGMSHGARLDYARQFPQSQFK